MICESPCLRPSTLFVTHLIVYSDMKHLDVIDGMVSSVPVAERLVPATIGREMSLVVMTLRLPDAEIWAVYTATPAINQVESGQFQDYVLMSNGLTHSTPCECSLSDEPIHYVDDKVLDQLDEEGVGFTDMSTVLVVSVFIKKSYTALHDFRLII